MVRGEVTAAPQGLAESGVEGLKRIAGDARGQGPQEEDGARQDVDLGNSEGELSREVAVQDGSLDGVSMKRQLVSSKGTGRVIVMAKKTANILVNTCYNLEAMSEREVSGFLGESAASQHARLAEIERDTTRKGAGTECSERTEDFVRRPSDGKVVHHSACGAVGQAGDGRSVGILEQVCITKSGKDAALATTLLRGDAVDEDAPLAHE